MITAVWPSQEGDRPVYVHTVVIWIRKLGPTLLLITCHDPNNPAKSLRYWGSTLLEADPQPVINTLAPIDECRSHRPLLDLNRLLGLLPG